VSDLEAELAEATRELSERETERAAAREAVERAERIARESRDARERRRRLEDRRANLQRRARAHLVERIRDEYERALSAVPGGPIEVERFDDPFAVEGVTAALAVGRVAEFRAPIVVACDRFECPGAAAEWLDATVLRV
jgi:multidrug resistance efflux pump